jgi:glycogen operon protein
MLLGGDELGRTQRGNNNAYCQDNDITWFDWSTLDRELLSFTTRLVAFRQAHPVFRRRRFLAGAEASDLCWYTPSGTAMSPDEWKDPNGRSVAIYLDGSSDPDRAVDGRMLLDDDFLVLVNGWWEALDFVIPQTRAGQTWYPEIDTFEPSTADATGKLGVGDRHTVGPRSIVVLRGPVAGA